MAGRSALRLLSAPTRIALIERVRAAQAGALTPVLRADAHRLAVVAEDADGIAKALAMAAARLAKDDKPKFNLANQMFYAATDAEERRGRTAFLFPGFGARHPTLVEDLVDGFAPVRRWFDALPAAARTRFEANPLMFPSRAKSAAEFVHTMEAALMGSLAMKTLLDQACPDLICDAMAGHSYGETALLHASGMVAEPGPIVDLLQNLWERMLGDRSLAHLAPTALLAVNLKTGQSIDDILRRWPVRVALDNCPNQQILCGPREDVAALAKTLRADGLVCFDIPDLALPVHTPQFPASEDALADLYGAIDLAPTKVPSYSCSTAEPFPSDPAAVRAILAAQWKQPVRFRQTVERLYADGIRTFVEVGPGGHLTGFVRDVLRGRDAVAIATNVESRGTLAQLHSCLAQMFVRGLDVDAAPFQSEAAPVVEKTAAPRGKSEQRALEQDLTQLVAEILELDSADLIDPRRGLFDLGLDSLQAVRLAEKIEALLGRPIAPTIAFDYPNIEALAAHLGGETAAVAATAPHRDVGEPIAVIGLACRLPGGADTPEACWQLLQSGGDAVGPIPDGRWDMNEIRAAGVDPDEIPHIFQGGFLDEIADFDCGFFGISRREALTLDPQQRLLLELSHEALERAGIAPRGLAGSATGVFVGISNADYAQRLSMAERIAIGGYMGTGNTSSTAAGRISFVLGLRGPCLALDTACSSSLVAVHLACRSLRSGESRMALAGGVNLLVSPETSISLASAGALSRDARCKTFDAEANGYVRGEGGAVVVLKRLSDALADGDPVLAVIRGSAINHDGRTSGFTVPNGPAQQQVIRAALTDAGVAPDAIDYVEAHGTGTALGDPIEVSALGAVFGQRPADAPLLIGSIKTNIGHLEAAAGLAALVKVVLQIQHGAIARSLNSGTLNPRIAWDRLPIAVAKSGVPWPARDRPRLAGISSFGISGTNAHIVVAEPPLPAEPARAPRKYNVLTLSAHSPAALEALRESMLARLEAADDFADICATSNLARDHRDHRLSVVADSADAARVALQSHRASRAGRRPKIAFLFSGQGSQMRGMGRGLFDSEPEFRAAIEKCEAGLRPHLKTPLTEILFGDTVSINDTIHAQPALFVLQYGLLRLWQSWGIKPDMVLGHSIGEFAAACAAGILDVGDALRLVAARGRLMQSLPAGGAMLAAAIGEATAEEFLRRHALCLSLAAVNGPASVVLSGAAHEIERAEALLKAAGARTSQLAVSHAFHSGLMEPILGEFHRIAGTVAYGKARIPFVGNLKGEIAEVTADYWTEQLRRTVRFEDGMKTLRGAGCSVFVELGPRPVLTAMARGDTADGVWLASLFPPQDEQRRMVESLAALQDAGAAVDWAGFHAGRGWRKAALPTTPFDRQRLWIERNPSAESSHIAVSPAPEARPERGTAPVIGRVRKAAPDARWGEVEWYVRRMIATVLGGADPHALPANEPLNCSGLDSLMALALKNELAADFGMDVKTTYLVGDATLSALCEQVLEKILKNDGAPDAAEIYVASAEATAFPLSHGQRALWFLWKVSPRSSAYSLSLPLEMPAGAEAQAWRAACRALVQAHPLLRARFVSDGDAVTQRIDPVGDIDWAEEDASELAEAMAAAHAQPFDLETGPPIRFRWFTGAKTVLLITMHHIVSDGWSLEIIRRQLPALARGETVKPSGTFESHARREAELLRGSLGETLWAYWRGQLEGPLPLLDLPADKPRPAVKSLHGDAFGFSLSAQSSARLKALAREAGTTSYVTLLAGFLAFLHRYSGQDDVLVGSPQAGRERPGTADVVGYFVDPIVIRSRMDDGQSFHELLAQTRKTVLGALDHAAFPFPLLVERLRPERDAGRSPLFDASFNFIAATPETQGAPAVAELAQGDGKFDLTLNIRDGATITGWFGYDASLFTREGIARMAQAFVALQEAAADAPREALGDLPMGRHGNFVPVLSGRRAELTSDDLVHRRVAAQPADRIAIVAPDGVMTYGELNARAFRTSRALRARGVRRGSLVGVIAQRSAEAVAAILAIHRAGGTPVLLDPRWPAALLTDTVHELGIEWVMGGGVLPYDMLADDGENIGGEAMPDDGAYVIFTSGSTGKPKGVPIDQRALANYVADMTRTLDVRGGENFALVSTLAADLGFTMVFPALASGGCLHIVPEEAYHDKTLFAAYMTANAIDYLKIVPSHFAALGGAAMPRKALILGGERAAPSWVAQLRRYAPACRILNHYGPTETTIGVMTGDGDGDAGDSLPLNRAVANTDIYILDRRSRSVAAGAVGELCVAGPCLARGYLDGRAQDSFVVREGVRMYRTGDLARLMPDGSLCILGRRDRQVKLRGYRIELGQIEAALRAQAGVRDCIVLPDVDGPGASRLLGFVTGPEQTEQALLRALQEMLPAYMVPARIVPTAGFPLTASGKVDVAALRSLAREERDAAAPALPRDAIELALARLWSGVLGVEPGIDDDFFRLGGHSLLAVKLLAHVQEHFGRRVPLAALLTHPTIARLAALLRSDAVAGDHDVLVPFGSPNGRPPLFLFPGAGGSLTYFVPLARHLGSQWQCFGLQAIGHGDDAVIPDRIEEIAARYVEAIRRAQPHGPYRLAGHSFGALVAFAVARLLQQEGETIAFLGLIDNEAPSARHMPLQRDDDAWLRHIATRIAKLARAQLRLDDLAGADHDMQVKTLLARLVDAGLLPDGVQLSHFVRFIDIYKANARAAATYRPEPLAMDAGVTVLRASDEDRELDGPEHRGDPTLGWSRLTPVGCVAVPGTHLTMFVEPHCVRLAEELGRCLSRTQTQRDEQAA